MSENRNETLEETAIEPKRPALLVRLEVPAYERLVAYAGARGLALAAALRALALERLAQIETDALS